MDCFELNFTKGAVFQPGTVEAFKHLRDEWISDLNLDNKYLIDWWAGNLCQISYRTEEKIVSELVGKGEFLKGFSSETQYAYICDISGIIFLVFQGSCTPEDNILDVKFLKKKYSEVGFHRGFLYAADALWEKVQPVIESYNGKVVMCGHSLGGAIAQIFASRISVKKLVTFGAPRVAGPEICELIKSPYTRYINCCDAVPHLPPKFFGFAHTGETIFIDDKQDLVNQEFLLPKFKASIHYFGSLNWCKPGLALTRSLTDHSPVNYCQAIARHLLQKELEK